MRVPLSGKKSEMFIRYCSKMLIEETSNTNINHYCKYCIMFKRLNVNAAILCIQTIQHKQMGLARLCSRLYSTSRWGQPDYVLDYTAQADGTSQIMFQTIQHKQMALARQCSRLYSTSRWRQPDNVHIALRLYSSSTLYYPNIVYRAHKLYNTSRWCWSDKQCPYSTKTIQHMQIVLARQTMSILH